MWAQHCHSHILQTQSRWITKRRLSHCNGAERSAELVLIHCPESQLHRAHISYKHWSTSGSARRKLWPSSGSHYTQAQGLCDGVDACRGGRGHRSPVGQSSEITIWLVYYIDDTFWLTMTHPDSVRYTMTLHDTSRNTTTPYARVLKTFNF